MTEVQRPTSWTVDAAVIAAIGTLSALAIWGRYVSHEPTRFLALDIAVAVIATALLPLMLRRPVTAALALTVLAALSPAATPHATVSALHVARWRRFPVALAVAAMGVAAHAVQGLWRPNHGLSFFWWLVLIAAAYAALVGWGALRQANRALVASLRERARRAEAEQGRRVAEARVLERTRIAREMHDVLAHRLSLLATYAGALEYRPDAPPEQLARAAGVVRDGAHQALKDLREVIGLLRDDETEDGARPQPTLADLPRLLDESRGAGVPIELRDSLAAGDVMPGVVGRTAYRIVQEALTNVRKHAPGQPVRVELDGQPGAGLTIDIRNALPRGPARSPAVPGTGTGLIGLTERVQLAGGRLDHETTSSGEFRLHASLPWPA
jgi:signal transduction histidine kinase